MSAPFTGQAESVVKFTLTAAQWTAQDRILQDNEIGIESDTGLAKWGNGSSAWSALSYFNSDSSVAVGELTGLGTGVGTALAVNVGSAGAPVVNGGALGTPSSGVATNLTGTAAGLTAGNATTAAALTGLGSSVAELDRFNDVSAYTESVIAAGALAVNKKVSNLAVVGGGAVTLAVPDGTMLGQIKVIEMTVDDGDCTLALTNVQGGSQTTTATFDAVGEKLVLIAAADKWVVVAEVGVTLS